MNASATIHNKLKFSRILSFAVVLAAILLFYIIRLFSLQIISGDEWAAKAEDNRLLEISLEPARGVIFDRLRK